MKNLMKKFLSIIIATIAVFSTSAVCLNASAASSSDTITVVLNDSTIRYTTANLNLRSSASTSSKVKVVLPKGLPVYVQKASGNWCYVKAYPKGDCYTGWVSKSYLSEWNVLGAYRVEATAGLNVRAAASTSAKKLGALKYNTKVNVFGITGDWAMIKYNGKTAYVALKYLRCVA
ncbi:MAG: SH3 domain-containing protein [Acutalibacteraceae bacterium]